MKVHHLIAALALAGIASVASAQHMKPGLWEINNKMQMGAGSQMDNQMAQMQQQLANMPPDQRKMVEEMMAKQGMRMGQGGPGGGMSVKVCMSKEQIERNEMPSNQRGDCKTTVSQRTGNTMKMAFTCSNPPSSGEGQVTFTTNEGYTMHMDVNTQVQGRPEKVSMDATGKWLGADCGDIKPMVPRK